MRTILTMLVLAALATTADAGPFRKRATYKSCTTSTCGPAGSTFSHTESYRGPAGAACTGDRCADALHEVNALRAARGLPPYANDPTLAAGALSAAQARASSLMFGHTPNDFNYLPAGATAAAAGCAAYHDGYGWMSCAVYDSYRTAGAAWVRGADGKRYMQLFVR